MSYYNHHTQAPPDGTPTGVAPSAGERTYTRSGERRDRRSSDYAMNVDSLAVGDMSMYAQPQQQPLVPMQPDYHSYSTTTAQMIDPWSFNHANLLSHLSQLPPDLLPSLLPQMNQMQYHANSRMTAQNMPNAAMAAVAAAAAAAAASASMAGIGRQPLPNEHNFAMPAIPLHRQPGSTKVGGPATLLPRPDDQQRPQPHFAYQREPAPATQFQPQHLAQFPQLSRQQQPSQPQQQNAYAQNLYYNTPPSLQPLMLPPPSPTILSYYTADPTQWMSLLGQNAYQPQAYHYDYPVPPHQLPFNFPMQQQQQQRRFPAASAMAGGSGGAPAMLLTQQYAPPGPLQTPITPVTLPPIDQALHQSNMAAVVAAQMVAAAASATGQYPQSVASGGSGMAFPAMPQQQLQSLQFESQNGAVGAYVPTLGLPQQQQLEGYYQPVRRSSSVTNLARLQQQLQQQQQQQLLLQQPALRAGFGAQAFLSGSATGLPNQAAASILSGANIMPSFQQQQQQATLLSGGQHMLGATPGYYTGTGGYVPSQSVFNSVGARPPALNASRSHGAQQQAGPRISIAQKAQQNLTSLLGGTPKGASNYLQALASTSAGVVDVSAPLALPGTADYVPGTRFTRQQASEESVRDHILQNAHLLYSSNARSPVLIEMLLCVHQLHPRHLPTLLLLACAYFSSGQADKSLQYNELILKIDPNYVEAMSNIGTTLRSMGKAAEAENWWWQAVKLRPGYWDAVENLMGVLCNAATGGSKDAGGGSGPRYREALQLCEFVDNSLRMGDEVSRGGTGVVGKYQVQEKQLSRLQSLLYSEGNLRFALGDVAGARREYEKAMEAVLGGYRLDEVIMRIASVGALEGINQMFHQQLHHQLPPSHNLSIDSLPLTLLAPENAVRVLQTLFPETRGVLPGFVGLSSSKAGSAPATSALQQANHVASNLVLQLAKLHQDHAVVAQPLSIVLPLYYMSLALEASPSTCNNLGIILSAIPSPQTETFVPSLQGGQHAAQAPMGSALAMQYYTQGLGLDRRHPHLYTNLGSLLKDLGYVAEAVRMYEKAVEFNPTFDVALANLGNAIKDMGRVQESVAWYLRAVQASPNFVEAVCGLANAMAGVCDWRARDGLGSEMAVRWQATALEADEMAEQIFLVMSRGKRPAAPEYALKLRKMISYGGSPPKESPKGGALGVADKRRGWMDRVVEIADQQLSDGRKWGCGLLAAGDPPVPTAALAHFVDRLCRLLPLGAAPPGPLSSFVHAAQRAVADASSEEWRRLARQMRCEGGWALRLAERVMAEVQRRLFWGTAGAAKLRPQLPTGLPAPSVPTVLPFHTFTYPLDAREIRLISHRNALRLSFSTLSGGAPWLPRHVYPPPPVDAVLRIGYVSSDFTNHPLAHLMQSVFGMHDRRRFQVICYATTAADGSAHRLKIEAEADVFVDCAAWSTARIVERIASDGIHVLVNLNGYTKGARNEIFAARPAPVLVAFMGFAGTLGAGWCDYVVTDPIVCPPWTVRCEVRAERLRLQGRKPREMQEVKRASDQHPVFDSWDFGELDPEEDCGDWVYTERMIYMPHTYFVNDHRQGFREDEDVRGDDPESVWRAEVAVRWRMRQSVFPQLGDDAFIFANFNQLYKIDPALFRMWLRILERCPRAIIWLLRFPAAGEQHLRRVAVEWSGPEVASRVVFTDVAPKHVHIKRGCVADAFLDTPECNAHTTAVDILWSGTPVLTWPRHEHKLCSRVAASVVCATGHGRDMVVGSADEYIERAVEWAQSASHRYEGGEGTERVRVGCGPAADLRRRLFLARDQSRLFDTQRWTRNLERGLEEAWRRWTIGQDDAPMTNIDDDDDDDDDDDGSSEGSGGDEVHQNLKWAERIERRLLANKSSNRPAVYAPPGRSIWVCDEDD
ncbi:hypothetical protein GGH94_005967, partial [Coemansia aciculifera]